MIVELVSQIKILESGKLVLILESGGKPDYQHIYREGREVYWDDDLKGFISPIPRKWSYLEWVKHICLVTEDVGIKLQISNSTKFNKLSGELVESIFAHFDIENS